MNPIPASMVSLADTAASAAHHAHPPLGMIVALFAAAGFSLLQYLPLLPSVLFAVGSVLAGLGRE